MSKCKIAFIMEGEKREKILLDNVEKEFKFSSKFEIIKIPAGFNLFMLYKELEKDNFDTSTIEVLREKCPQIDEQLAEIKEEDFSEIYLFFDLDIQSRECDLDEFLQEINLMLSKFDNETENGKLYISYPMVEAIRDLKNNASCVSNRNCYVDINETDNYKEISSQNQIFCDFKKYSKDIWSMVISAYVNRYFCLKGDHKCYNISLSVYKNLEVTPLSIYVDETRIIKKEQKMFILSGVTQFIIDYFNAKKLSGYDLLYLNCYE